MKPLLIFGLRVVLFNVAWMLVRSPSYLLDPSTFEVDLLTFAGLVIAGIAGMLNGKAVASS